MTIPDSLLTVIVGFCSWVLAMWRGQAITDTKLAGLTQRVEDNAKLCALMATTTADGVRDVTREFRGSIEQVRNSAVEYAAAMKMAADTLRSLVNKIEAQEMVNAHHDARLGVLERALQKTGA